MFASSLDRLKSVCDLIFNSVERSDLSDSLDRRLGRYNNFAGIDHDKPLGIMFVWGNDSPHIVFLPVKEINDLLVTTTFGVVDFHQVGVDQYEIERPAAPYRVLVRNQYAFISESISTIRAIRITPDQLTRRLRDQYDLAVHFDLRQIPKVTKTTTVDLIKGTIEPLLQTGDDEATESGKLRRALGVLALDIVELAALDTSTLTIGIRLDPELRHLRFEIVAYAEPRSRMANALNQFSPKKSQFFSFIQSDVAAGFVVNMAANGMIREIFGSSDDRPAKGSRLEAGFQLAGEKSGDRSLVVGLSGPDVETLNNVLPNLLLQLEKSAEFERFHENCDVYRGVVLHSLVPREIPKSVAEWFGSELEILVGQRNETLWVGIGSPGNLMDHLEKTIELVDNHVGSRSVVPFARAQIQGRKLPELVASNILIPNLNADMVRAELSRGDDGFSVKIEPVTDGVKLSVEFEEGFVRLIGRDWIRQIENASHE